MDRKQGKEPATKTVKTEEGAVPARTDTRAMNAMMMVGFCKGNARD